MDIAGILAAANPSSTATATSQGKFGQDYSQFLRLLTTQLQNQDPMSPMDSSQFTSQLVQFSAVEQQIKANDFLQKQLSMQSLNLTTIGLGYVGLNVQTPGSSFQFDGASPAQLSYSMPDGAVSGTMSIIDANGAPVSSLEADLSIGTHSVFWDGKDDAGNPVPAGTYKIIVGAQDAQQRPLSVPTFTSGRVTGLETGDDGSVSLVIGDKKVPVTDVRKAGL